MAKIKDKVKKLLLNLRHYLRIDTLYLARGGFWISSTFFLSSILGLVQVVIFANFLPKEAYGTYKYILSLAGAFSFLTLTGMNDAVTQATAKHESLTVLRYAVKVQLKWNFIFSIVMTGLSGYYFISNNLLLAKSLLLLGITFPLASALNTYGAFLVGKKDFKRSSIYGVITSIIQITSLSVTATFTDDIFVLILVYALTVLVANIFFYLKTTQLYKQDSIKQEQKTELLKFSGHLSFMHILSGAAQYVDKLVIFHYLGAVELAVYGLALAVPERARGYIKTMSNMIMPKLAGKTTDTISTTFYKRIFQGMLIGTVMSIVYIFIAPIFYKIFLPKYLEAVTYSQVFSLTLIFVLPNSYMSGIFNAHKMIRPMYYSSLSTSFIKILLYLILGKIFGIWGVIMAILFVHIWSSLYNIRLLSVELHKNRPTEYSGVAISDNRN